MQGARLGTFTATWVTSNINAVLGAPAAAGRTGTSGDQYQESSLWTLDGNDLEKSLFDRGMVFEECERVLLRLNSVFGNRFYEPSKECHFPLF